MIKPFNEEDVLKAVEILNKANVPVGGRMILDKDGNWRAEIPDVDLKDIWSKVRIKRARKK